MKYVITSPPNHPYRVVFFSPQNFRTTGYGTDVLLVLPRREYDLLDSFTRTQQCHKAGFPLSGGMITAHNGGHVRVCQLAEDAACDYLTVISTLPGIHWTEEQKLLIHGQSWDTECKDSGWWENQEKVRRAAEDWAKLHGNDGTPENLPVP
jgi:hypothetical protein